MVVYAADRSEERAPTRRNAAGRCISTSRRGCWSEDEASRAWAAAGCSGLSAETGDDGQVGRGNRVNGLITPNGPMSLEASTDSDS